MGIRSKIETKPTHKLNQTLHHKMKLILTATPFLAKIALSLPALAQVNMEELLLQEVAQLNNNPSVDCSDVWNSVCTGTNSNGDPIIGSWTCGERVQYVHDYKLGRNPTLSAAIEQVLSECPTQCQELENNQCDLHAETNLEIPDCSATWDRDCTDPRWGTFTCGARVQYDQNHKQMSLADAISNTNRRCGAQCREFQNGNCDTFISQNVVAVPSLNQVIDDYETVASVETTTRPLATCQEAFDRDCTDPRWGTFTCGARIQYDQTHKQMSLDDAISNTNRQCPTQCREFQNGNCDTFLSENVVAVPSLNQVIDDYETV